MIHRSFLLDYIQANCNLYEVFKVQCRLQQFYYIDDGDGEIRTLDPLLARQVLSQLSYAPIWVTYLIIQSHSASGLEKTRTSDLTLIRRAL